jgi:thiosulfate/3-mercaptopyruvate sulfurtransferase
MTPSPLISAEALHAALEAAANAPVVLDCGFELSDPPAGERAYAAAHVPGAHYAHLDRDLSGPLRGDDGVFRGRHPLPSREALAAALGRWGIGPDTPVVAYDAHGGPYAARAWWLLRWMGHDRVSVLDGGLQAWRAAGLPVTDAVPAPAAAGPYPARGAAMPTLDAAALEASLGRVRLVDARVGERFRGEVEPLDPQPGHVPGARNRCFKDNLAPGGRFKPPEALRAEFAPLVAGCEPAEVVHMCGSGVTAAHNVLAMAQAGFGLSALYPGSWSEWCADPRRPVARGA